MYNQDIFLLSNQEIVYSIKQPLKDMDFKRKKILQQAEHHQ